MPANRRAQSWGVCVWTVPPLATIIVNVPVTFENLPVVWIAYKDTREKGKETMQAILVPKGLTWLSFLCPEKSTSLFWNQREMLTFCVKVVTDDNCHDGKVLGKKERQNKTKPN